MQPFLSLILPAFNEAQRLPPYLNAIRTYLDRTFTGRYEILVVDDGSTDGLSSLLASLYPDWSDLRILSHPENLGKGAALRTGVLAAHGEILLTADADGASPIAEEAKLRQALEGGAQVAIGSRLGWRAQDAVQRTFTRYWLGRLFASIVRRMLHLPLGDTQCGFKMFRETVAQRIFRSCSQRGFLIDVEVLLEAKRQECCIAEVPVSWSEIPGSKVRLCRDGWRMVCGLYQLRSASSHRSNRDLLSRSLAISALLLLMLIAGYLRCRGLDSVALHPDEAFSWRLIQCSPPELSQRTAADVHPPLYYLMLQAWVYFWGDSLVALRGLSVLFGVFCLPVVYLLCIEVSLRRGEDGRSATPWARSGALFAVLLLAVRAEQIQAAQTARMYTLGVLLAGLTTWLLLRALRAPRDRWWWFGYGLAVAAFCYTHYYAFFTIFAQVLFVITEWTFQLRRQPIYSTLQSAGGFLSAGVLALLIYLPWFPVWHQQTSEVWRNFWAPVVPLRRVADTFLAWSAGSAFQGLWEARVWLVLLVACTLGMLASRDRGGYFLLLQVVVPWLACLAISTWSERPLFVERYLIFAQLFLLAFWGLVWTRLPGRPERLCLGILVLMPALFGLWSGLPYEPTRPPALALAADFLKQAHQPGDAIWTDNPIAVNSLRYYAAQAGLFALRVQCPAPPAVPGGHVPHVAALTAREILPERGEMVRPLPSRVWRASPSSMLAQEAIAGMRKTTERVFQGGDATLYTLVLYESVEK
jgi:dolichyl-phosphate beta-glucosyltransferase